MTDYNSTACKAALVAHYSRKLTRDFLHAVQEATIDPGDSFKFTFAVEVSIPEQGPLFDPDTDEAIWPRG